jgi:uncharacterized membrane protein
MPFVILTIIGLAVSVVLDGVHQRLVADVNYTSFCSVSTLVNCDVVLGSPYAVLLGVAVSRWAMLYFTMTFGIGSAVASTREYHTFLFDNQQHLGRELLIGYAARLGLDTPYAIDA